MKKHDEHLNTNNISLSPRSDKSARTNEAVGRSCSSEQGTCAGAFLKVVVVSEPEWKLTLRYPKERLMCNGAWYSHWFGAARPLSSRCGCLCSTAGAAMQVMCASAACLCASVHTRRLPSILAEKLGQVASTAAGSSRNSFREVKVFVGVWLQTRDRNFWFPPRWREHSLNREASASSLQWGTNRTAHTAHVYVCGYLLAARCSPLQAIPHSYLRPCCGSGCVLFLGAE